MASLARWNKSAIPTVINIPELLPARAGSSLMWQIALINNSTNSPLDHTHGNFEHVLARLSAATPTSVTAMSQAFTANICPLGSAPGTRVKAWRNWCSCLTWAVGRQTTDKLLPMASETLQAMLWDFTSMGATKSTLKSIVDAVISRHRDAQLPSPLTGPRSYLRLTSCLGRLLGTQHQHKMGITRDMIVQLLRYRPRNLVEFRNKNVVCTLTIGCMRPAEGAQAQSCSLDFDADFRKGLTQYVGCSTLTTLHRKNDQERKGHWMRFGKSSDPQLDINYQLGLFMDMANTRPSTACTARSRPGRRCTSCPPLFPKLVHGPGDTWTLHPDPVPSPALISSMVVSALRMINVDTSSFSGVSCRMGGLTIATEAGVPENIMWMQSGHAQDRAARRYVRLTNPDRLYDTWRAFRL